MLCCIFQVHDGLAQTPEHLQSRYSEKYQVYIYTYIVIACLIFKFVFAILTFGHIDMYMYIFKTIIIPGRLNLNYDWYTPKIPFLRVDRLTKLGVDISLMSPSLFPSLHFFCTKGWTLLFKTLIQTQQVLNQQDFRHYSIILNFDKPFIWQWIMLGLGCGLWCGGIPKHLP